MPFDEYDPNVPPTPGAWLALDEGKRVDLVIDHHASERIRLANARLHAAVHVVVENQLALGEPAVREALERLQREGLRRHDALHAIGSAATALVLDLASGNPEAAADARRAYERRLSELTAKAYLEEGE